MRNILSITAVAAVAILAISGTAMAGDAINVEIKNGAFNPATIEVPANQKVQLVVKNSETAEAEFESYTLNREVKIKAGESANIFVGPLDAGSYPIFDDNNPDAKGTVVAK